MVKQKKDSADACRRKYVHFRKQSYLNVVYLHLKRCVTFFFAVVISILVFFKPVISIDKIYSSFKFSKNISSLRLLLLNIIFSDDPGLTCIYTFIMITKINSILVIAL